MTENTCIWTGSETPRALPGRHLRDCEASDCRGCEPCTERHCMLCGKTHVDEPTCPACIGHVRADLDDIATLCRHLRQQAGNASRDSEPHRDHVLGGSAMAMMVGANYGGMGSDYGSAGDPQPPLATLASWEDDWRDVFDHGAAGKATIRGAKAYLDIHLSHAAQHHPAFDEFAGDIRRTRGALEDVLHDGKREETGAPCPLCGKGALVKSYGASESDDRWQCRNRECRTWWTDADYRSKVAATYELHAAILTASAIARVYRIAEGTVRVWANRGKVRKRGQDQGGRQLYDVADVLAARDGHAERGDVGDEREVV